MDVKHLIDAVAAGADPSRVLEDEPSTFSKISNFIFGRGVLKQAASSGSAGTPSTTSTGGGSGFAPSPGMGGKSLADLAQDQANRSLGKTSTVVHKSASSTSAPPVKSPSSAPPAVKPVSKPPVTSKPLTQSRGDEFSLGEMEHGLTKGSRMIARVKQEPTMFSKEGAKAGAKAVVNSLRKAVSPSYKKRSDIMGRFDLQAESRVSLLVRAVVEGADPCDVLRVAPRIIEAAKM